MMTKTTTPPASIRVVCFDIRSIPKKPACAIGAAADQGEAQSMIAATGRRKPERRPSWDV